MISSKIRFQLAIATLAALASTSAFAVRYWRGAIDGALFSEPKNWFKKDDGTVSDSKPDTNKGDTYWYNNGSTPFDMATAGRTVFDEAASVAGDKICIGTGSESAFVWSATDPSYGLTAAGQEFRIGYNKSPSYLQIDSGTYSFGTTRIGYTANCAAGLLMTGGDFTTGKLRIAGYAADGGIDGKLEIRGGTMRTTKTGDDAFWMCLDTDIHNTSGTLIIDGGTLDVSSGNDMQMGGPSNTTIFVHIKSGELICKGMILGGKAHKTAYAVDNAVSRLVMDGGTFTLNCISGHEPGIGFATGKDSYAEMIVNDGTINCNFGYFYVAERGPARFEMNGGTFTMLDADDGGFTLGRSSVATAVGTAELNGGELTTRKIRVDYAVPGCKVIFNGTTIKPTRNAIDFLEPNKDLVCEVGEGGLVIDTAGYDVRIAHDLIGTGPLVKKGEGTLIIAGAHNFTKANITVLGGDLVGVPVDGSGGGDLGTMVVHDVPFEGWLTNSNFNAYEEWGANGNISLEQPRPVIVEVNGATRTYENLEIGITTNDTLNGVSYSFSTESVAPRTMKVVAPSGEVVENVRDMGGWPLLGGNGKRIKQGVVFRGSDLDPFVGATADQRAASALANIKSEIDTRLSSEVVAGYPDAPDPNAPKSYAAIDADYVFCPMSGTQIDSYDSGVTTNQLRRVFSTLGTPGMLPSYVHCRIGRDRTGLFGMLLLGLLGVDDAAICRDYLASNFANVGGTCSRATPEDFIRYLHRGTSRTSNIYVYNGKDALYGKSVASRCRQYLEMCGVTSEEINNITMALTGETADQVLARVNAYESANGVRTVHYVACEGSATNASHRLAPGADLFPYKDPTREKYIFIGWDTENPEANDDGSVTVYGIWLGQCRFWADSNGDEESFANGDSWDPYPGESGLMPFDTLALNKGIWKVAKLSDGDDVTVENVYVGWGTTNGTSMARELDLGGRLDVTGGTLYATNCFYVGGSYSDYSNNVVNVTGGTVKAGILRTGDCNCNGGSKCDTLNISGDGVVEAGLADNTTFGRSSVGLAYVNVTNGGTFISYRQMDIGYRGEAHLLLDGGTVGAANCTVNVPRNKDASGSKGFIVMNDGTWTSGTVNFGKGGDENGYCYGEATVSGGTFNVANIVVGGHEGTGAFFLDGGTVNTTAESSIGSDAASTGTMHIASGVFNAAGDAFRIGKKGRGVLTMDGGTLNGVKDLKISTVDGVPGSEFNLNGGIVNAGKLTTSANAPQTMNWNGGTLSCDGSAGDVTFFPENTYVKVNVLWNGAIYETAEGREDATDVIAQPMSGAGALVKRGGGTLSMTGALDLAGGFRVEGGTLSVSNLARTYFLEISVDDGCNLDLNGAEVTVTSYKVAGVAKEAGVYEECNGVITVAPVGALVPDTAEWINYAGDGDVANPTNWIVRTATGLLVPYALPDANTEVLVPAGGARPDLSGLTIKGSTYVVAKGTSMRLRGDCTPPAVVAEAIAWYDPDDELTLEKSIDGTVTGIKNKGKEGAALDLVAYDQYSLPTINPAYSISTRQPLVFPSATMGFVSKTSYLFDAQTGASLVAVMHRLSGGPAYGIELDNTDGNSRLCGIAGNTDHAVVTVRAMSGGVPSEYRLTGLNNQDDGKRPIIYDLSVGPTSVSAHNMRTNTSNDVSLYTANDMESLTDGAKTGTMSYESLPSYGALNIYYGMRRQASAGSYALMGEAMAFARPLTDDECAQIREYLRVKWFNVYDMSNIPENITVEEGAEIDFGGGLWTFGDVKGTGTVDDDIKITNSIEPGLTVNGTVVFASGAKFDISPLDDVANGTEVVFLTANGIVDWPLRATSGKHSARLSLVDNGDGTVSLVGTLTASGFLFNVR